jgi:hypothetical protein
MRHDDQTEAAGLCGASARTVPRQGYGRDLVLAGLVAAGLLIVQAPAVAADTVSAPVAATPATGKPRAGSPAKPRVSPYVVFRRQHEAAANAAESPSVAPTTRRSGMPAGQKQRRLPPQ